MTSDDKVALLERAMIVPGEAGRWLARLPDGWNKVCTSCDEAREVVWRAFEAVAERHPPLPAAGAAAEPQYRCLSRHEVIFPGDEVRGRDTPWFSVDRQAYFTPSEWNKMAIEFCVFRRPLT